MLRSRRKGLEMPQVDGQNARGVPSARGLQMEHVKNGPAPGSNTLAGLHGVTIIFQRQIDDCKALYYVRLNDF